MPLTTVVPNEPKLNKCCRCTESKQTGIGNDCACKLIASQIHAADILGLLPIDSVLTLC